MVFTDIKAMIEDMANYDGEILSSDNPMTLCFGFVGMNENNPKEWKMSLSTLKNSKDYPVFNKYFQTAEGRIKLIVDIKASREQLIKKGVVDQYDGYQAGAIPKDIAIPLRTIQGYGNFAMHDQDDNPRPITPEYIQPCLHALAVVVNWYVADHQRYSIGLDRSSDQSGKISEESVESERASASAGKSKSVVGRSPGGGAVPVTDFAASRGLTPSAVIRMARDVLHLELRTPSALLQEEQIKALEDALLSKQAVSSQSPGEPVVHSFDLGSGTQIEFVLVPGGSFTMGSPVNEEATMTTRSSTSYKSASQST